MPSKEAAELVPLSWVAAVAYEEFVRPRAQEGASRNELIDLLALGISLDAPIYAAGEGGDPRPMAAIELAGGRFAGGAVRFEFYDGRPALNDLRVNIGELPMVVRTVVALKSGHLRQR
jgi:hypothetical protein